MVPWKVDARIVVCSHEGGSVTVDARSVVCSHEGGSVTVDARGNASVEAASYSSQVGCE
jgi:hypothetical protein